MATSFRKTDPISPALRQKLNDAHRGLLHVHKSLIDYERARYERAHGPLSGPGEFLQLVIHDPAFAWLRPVSGLVAQIDQFLDSKEPVDPAVGEALAKQAAALLTPSESGDAFQQAYHRAVQESPEVAARHAEWKRTG